MSTNFDFAGKLRCLALCLAAPFCAGQAAETAELAATDIQVAVIEPSGGPEVRNYIALVRSAFIETVSKTDGFQVIDRAKTDQILKEHGVQAGTKDRPSLVAESEVRKVGKMLGVDIIFSSDVTEQPDAIHVGCQALNIETGRIVASRSEAIEGSTSKQVMETCRDMMADMLRTINRNSGNRATAAKSVLPGLDAEIAKMVKDNKSNAKWNRNKKDYGLDVDLAGVSIVESRQFETPFFSVRGTITISLNDAVSGDTVQTDVELERITEMNEERIRNQIKAQVQPKLNEIVRELLSGLPN